MISIPKEEFDCTAHPTEWDTVRIEVSARGRALTRHVGKINDGDNIMKTISSNINSMMEEISVWALLRSGDLDLNVISIDGFRGAERYLLEHKPTGATQTMIVYMHDVIILDSIKTELARRMVRTEASNEHE
jgi:hypothetical protein